MKTFSSQIAADLSDPVAIGFLLQQYALHSNSSGVVLFSTTNPARITAIVKAAESSIYDEAQLARFAEFVDQILDLRQQTGAQSPRTSAS